MRIQCPRCAQRFTVEAELMGKIVECGACDHRFEVSEEVEVNKPKAEFKASMRKEHAPGEKPLENATVAGSLKPSKKAPSVDYKDPISPIQILGAMAAIFITAVIWIFFIYGSRYGGALQDMELGKCYLLAGSFAVLVIFLFVVSIRNNRLLGVLLGLLFGGSLLAGPWAFPPKQVDIVKADEDLLAKTELRDRQFSVTMPLEVERPLIERVGEMPLREGFENFGREKVIGIMLTGLDDTLVPQVKRYVARRLKSEGDPMSFDRVSGTFLVVGPTSTSYEEAVHLLEEIGEITDTDENMRILELAVRRELFALPPQGKLNSPSSPDFYRLNALELKAYDYDRVRLAAERLKEVRPVQMRGDIRHRLIERINQVQDAPAVFHVTLAEALTVWAKDDDPEAVAAVEYAVQLGDEQGILVTRELLSFLLKRGSQVGERMVTDRWKVSPSEWEVLFLDLKVDEDEQVLEPFFEALRGGTLNQKRSAASLLGTIGGKKALQTLKSVAADPAISKDVELKVQVERSIEALENRLGVEAPRGEDGAAGDAPPLPDPEELDQE